MQRMKLNIQLFASGTIEFPYNGNLQGKLEWSSSGDVNSNSSNVTCSLYARRNMGYTLGPDWTGNITIDGTTSYFNGFNYSVEIRTDWVLIFTAYKTVQHNNDGSKSITISGAITGPSGTSLAGKTSSGSGTATLDNLHKPPVFNYTITERQTNLVNAGVSGNVFVENLSQKRFTFNVTTLYDGATISLYRVYNRTKSYSSSSSSTIDVNFANNQMYFDVDDPTKVMINCLVQDTKGGVTYSGVNKYNYIPYIKPSFNTTATTTKRNGQTSGKVRLNVSANFYNGTVGNVSNTPVIKYKFWQDGTSEPSDSNYITINSSYYSKSGNTVSISNYEIGSTTQGASNYFDFNNKYYVKIRINDSLSQVATITTTIIKGLAVWSEYKDRVDFMNISMGGLDIFPVGYVFLTTDGSFNPNGHYKGTWEKLSADAYFKIVQSGAGSLGGTSSTHQIPLSSMPPHTHNYGAGAPYRTSDGTEHYSADMTYNPVATTTSAGGGQAYYPYYYGVIAWHRTA